MNIQTKYAIKQNLWFMHENKAKCAASTELHIGEDGIVWHHLFKSGEGNFNKNESHLFAAKDELLKSL
jgi:hypothetical protein